MTEKIEDRMREVCERMLTASRTELYLHMRFLDVALSRFAFVCSPGIEKIGTDGMGIYYHPGYLGGLYREGRVFINRAYLHMLLHCLFVHLWKDVSKKKQKARQMYEAAGYSTEEAKKRQICCGIWPVILQWRQ